MRRLKKILFWLSFIYCVALLILYLFQENILFQPEKLPVDYTFQFDHEFKEFFLETNDHARLNGLHFLNKNPKGTILYFHGNKGSLKRWGEIALFFAKKNFDVIIMDYRGYGKSTGTLTEQKLYEDAQLFYNYMRDRYPENSIIIYGRSLGTGIALKMAANNTPNSIILETPYYSIKDMASRWMPDFLAELLISYKIPSHQYIQDVHCNITIYHGTDDGVVPYASGLKLFNIVPRSNKRMITIKNGSHNNLIDFEEYQKSIDKVLQI